MKLRRRAFQVAFQLALLATVPGSAAVDVCDAQAPSFPGLRVEHGVVDSQIAIDFKKKGPARFHRRDRARLIEIERIWGHGGKTIVPERASNGKLVGIHLAFYLKAKTVSGVGVWSMELAGTDLFAEGAWLLSGAPFRPESPLVLNRGDRAHWGTLTALLPASRPTTPSEAGDLRFYARTLFHQPWLPGNVVAGSRVDACAYFLYAD